MPFIGGDNLIHVSELDYIVEVDRPVLAVPPAPVGEWNLKSGVCVQNLSMTALPYNSVLALSPMPSYAKSLIGKT